MPDRPAPEMVYWDSCLFIDILERKKIDRLAALDQMHKLAEKRRLLIVTSALTIVEVNKFEEEGGGLPEKQSKKILDFFENPYISIRQLDRLTAETAHGLTRTHGLMPADAIHVATALLAKVPVLYTFDTKKNRRKGLIRHDGKIGSPPLRIEVPKPDYGELFRHPSEEAEEQTEQG